MTFTKRFLSESKRIGLEAWRLPAVIWASFYLLAILLFVALLIGFHS